MHLGRDQPGVQLVDCSYVLLVVELRRWRLHPALFRDEVFQLHDAHGFGFDHLLRLSVDPVIRVQLFLKLDYSLIPLVESGSESDHDVPLLEQQLLVPVHLLLVLLQVHPFLLDFLQLRVVLLSDHPVLLLQSGTELGMVLNFLSSSQHLGVHSCYLLLQAPLGLLFILDFLVPGF